VKITSVPVQFLLFAAFPASYNHVAPQHYIGTGAVFTFCCISSFLQPCRSNKNYIGTDAILRISEPKSPKDFPEKRACLSNKKIPSSLHIHLHLKFENVDILTQKSKNHPLQFNSD